MTNPSWICPRPAHWPVRPDGHQQTTAAWRARFVYLTLLLNLVGTAHYIAFALGPLLVLAVLVDASGRRRAYRVSARLLRRLTRRPEPVRPTRRPLRAVAADVGRLSARYHREGMRFAQYEGRRQAFDRVLGEAAEMLEIGHLLDVLAPGPELDRERERIEHRLVGAGLLPDPAAS